MKRRVLLLVGAGALLMAAGPAAAITLTDTTYFTAEGTNETVDYVSHGWGDVNKLDAIFDYVTWAHQYEFNPPASGILSAQLEVYLRDNETDTWRPSTWELGIGYAEGGTWAIGAVNTGAYSYDVSLAAVGDGRFQVTVASLLGDFYIDRSVLTIDYEAAPSNPVPEPGTMLLLGSGLIGLAGVSRRRKPKA